MDANYNPVDVKFRETNDGIYSCNYVPKKGAKHTVQVKKEKQFKCNYVKQTRC